jgi:hypothetical protein
MDENLPTLLVYLVTRHHDEAFVPQLGRRVPSTLDRRKVEVEATPTTRESMKIGTGRRSNAERFLQAGPLLNLRNVDARRQTLFGHVLNDQHRLVVVVVVARWPDLDHAVPYERGGGLQRFDATRSMWTRRPTAPSSLGAAPERGARLGVHDGRPSDGFASRLARGDKALDERPRTGL